MNTQLCGIPNFITTIEQSRVPNRIHGSHKRGEGTKGACVRRIPRFSGFTYVAEFPSTLGIPAVSSRGSFSRFPLAWGWGGEPGVVQGASIMPRVPPLWDPAISVPRARRAVFEASQNAVAGGENPGAPFSFSSAPLARWREAMEASPRVTVGPNCSKKLFESGASLLRLSWVARRIVRYTIK